MDLLLNPLAPQDYIPLGITWVASWLLELVAALFNPVPLDPAELPLQMHADKGTQPLSSLETHWEASPPPPESRVQPCNSLFPLLGA